MALTGISELLDMVKAVTGPDRNIDAMLHSWSLNGIGTGNYADAPKYSESIDAALALVERVLPGRSIAMGISSNPSPFAAIAPNTLVNAKTLPLAILAALLSALIAKESSNDQ